MHSRSLEPTHLAEGELCTCEWLLPVSPSLDPSSSAVLLCFCGFDYLRCFTDMELPSGCSCLRCWLVSLGVTQRAFMPPQLAGMTWRNPAGVPPSVQIHHFFLTAQWMSSRGNSKPLHPSLYCFHLADFGPVFLAC